MYRIEDEMVHSLDSANENLSQGHITLNEIWTQPTLWSDTFARIRNQNHSWSKLVKQPGIICGAGSSAYASAAIQMTWPFARAIPSTELLLDTRGLEGAMFMLSVARSGNSPESSAVIEIVRKRYPNVAQFAITCSSEGKLARLPGVTSTLLDPRTNDKGLAMTSSFSNLVLAGLTVSNTVELDAALGIICDRVRGDFPRLMTLAREIALDGPRRAAVLASPILFPWAQEAALKIMELTAGQVSTMAETYLGLRHGPMSFIDRTTLVLCLISNDSRRRSYELDLLAELRVKQIGRIVAVAPESVSAAHFDTRVNPMALELPDCLRTPFEIVFPQLLAHQCSLKLGLNPDNPSSEGIINRVVPDIPIH
jgi:tagatose-6-phosphate ketose/aldose isomerase